MSSKQRVIATTLRLLRRQGLSATGINRIIRESRSPRGSIYFHFPGGKDELTIEALRSAQRTVVERMQSAMRGGASTAQALRRVVRDYVEDLRSSGYEFGCPIANVTLDVSAESPRIRAVCAEIFADWQAKIRQALERDGHPHKEADAMAEFILSSLEGALILCRAQKSSVPLKRVAGRILSVLEASARCASTERLAAKRARAGTKPSA
jgi:TetR/AcrR family transcriptional repressor of lmrAB and yxaGH operons